MNKVILSGNLCREPEMKYTPSGTAICNFSIAVKSGYGKNEDTAFCECVCFGKTAENVSKYCSKGSKIIVDATYKQEKWEDNQGNKRSKSRFVCNSVEFLSSNKENNSSSQYQNSNYTEHQEQKSNGYQPQDNSRYSQNYQPESETKEQNYQQESVVNGDDIPF